MRTLFTVTVVACIACPQALAQTPVVPRVGQRVRVTSAVEHTPVMTGVVGAVGPDTLLLRADGTGSTVATAIPVGNIAQLDVSAGRHSHWVRGGTIGAIAGAAAGAVLGLATFDEDSDWLFNRGATAMMAAIVCAPVGAAVGIVVGALVKTERWETVSPVWNAPPATSDSRLSLGVRLAF